MKIFMTHLGLEIINTKHVCSFQPLFVIRINSGAYGFGG